MFCEVFELNGKRYALLGTIYPSFGVTQVIDVVEVRPEDIIEPNRLPKSVEVNEGDEGHFVHVKSARGWRQAHALELAVVVSVGNTAQAQLDLIDQAEGRGLSGG